jgi:nitroreductase
MDETTRHALVAAGIQAPSGDNSQPWQFRWRGAGLEIAVDAARAHTFFDVDGVASLISVGAVVANIELAAATRGWRSSITWLPAGEERGPAARLTFDPAPAAGAELAAAIPRRCVNRRPCGRRPLPADWLTEQAQQAGRHGTALTWITDGTARHRVSQIVRLADWVRFTHPRVHADFMAELRFTRQEAEESRDGLAIPTLESGPLAGPALRFLRPWPRTASLNRLGLYRALTTPTVRLVRTAPAVGLLSTARDTPLAYLAGGVAMQRLWLAATAAGIAFQPVTVATLFVRRWLRHGPGDFEPRHLPWLREAWDKMRTLFPVTEESGLVMLLRVGYAKPPRARSLRRPVESFLVE